jgi:hypothetical protein
VMTFLAATPALHKVVFCCFSAADAAVYARVLAAVAGP